MSTSETHHTVSLKPFARLRHHIGVFWFQNGKAAVHTEEGRSAQRHLRHEFKYVLSRAEAEEIQLYLEHVGLRRDSASVSEPYHVTSVYFDTPTLEDYYDKLAGLKFRRKLRARVYQSDFSGEIEAVWLEIKEKHDMSVHKKRSALPVSLWRQFLDRDMVGLLKHEAVKTSAFLREFFFLYLMKGYRPMTVVKYRRTAYVSSFVFPVRVTFDSDLQTCHWRDFAYNSPAMLPIREGAVIMEIKFRDAMPWWFGEILRRFKLSRQAFSKYVSAVDALNRLDPLPR
ncbi:MAG: polyphosphate polymerase domain-containing protein [Candidatus Taylorbacteria bacterium]|nr:polyphosphate polymerase domain-containing protein [Candidatus Taylorbacteria bacterium]